MNLPEDDIRIFNDSLDQCVANPRFMDIFYDKFIAAKSDIAERFAGVDMARQKRALKASLYSAMLAADGNPPAIEHLERLSATHRDLAVTDEHYELWRECLIAAVKECGQTVDTRVERAWRGVLAVAIAIMQGKTVEIRGGAES